MVGHTGVFDAAVEACGHTDEAIGKVYEACKKHGYVLFVTADHGYVKSWTSCVFTLNLKSPDTKL